ncbi:hypothetical protein LIA77_03134 [Sarocladium implicatum]|nr:hypothetical protein LIA77_03134 [Sarocladium implicatum]
MPLPDLFQIMAVELANARANKLFPPTSAPSTDVQSTAHDYELLLQLQHARNMTSSEAYDQLRVEVARRVRDRDDAYNQEANRDEAVRRVESYLRSVEHEKEHYESLSSSSTPSTPSVSSRCGDGCSTPKTNEDILSLCEHAMEQARIDVTKPLMEGIEHHADLNMEQQELRSEQKALHHQQVTLVEGQKDVLAEQSSILDRLATHADRQELGCSGMEEHVRSMSMMVEDSARNFYVLQNMLATTTTLNSHLSQTVVNLPRAINDIVEQAVQYQVNLAVTNISEAYQVATNDIEAQRQSLGEALYAVPGEGSRCNRGHDMVAETMGQNPRSSKRKGKSFVNSSLALFMRKLRKRV